MCAKETAVPLAHIPSVCHLTHSRLIQNNDRTLSLVSHGATSRERLKLQEEWLLVLHGLAFAHEDGAAASDALSAVQLFSQRARQVKADFDWMREETAVLRICQLVEGMPLGLELASAWVMQLSCQEIAAEITASLDFLQSETRNMPDRHRNVRAIFGHSWQMLTTKEKDVLQKLSVFRGGFDRTAAQAVAGASLPTLARLVSKSLLSVGENGRYAIHELLRQFAAEKLTQTEDAVFDTGRLHCHYFLTVLAEQGPKYSGPDFHEMVTIIERDLDNVRTAVQWAIQHQPHLFNHENGLALRFFYDSSTLYLEGEITFRLIAAQLKKALPPNQPASESDPVAPELLLWAEFHHYWGSMNLFLGHNLKADSIMKESLLGMPTHDPTAHPARAFCLATLGANSYYNGDIAQSITYLKECGPLFQGIGDTWGGAVTLWLQGAPELALGNMDTAQRVLEESEQLLKKVGSVKFRVRVLGHLARILLHKGEIARAEALTQQAQIGSIADITECLNWLGEAAYLKGDYRKAQVYHEQCLKMVTDVNLSLRMNRSLLNLGNLAVAEGNYPLAKAYFDQADATVNMNQSYIGGPGWAALGLGDWAEARHYFEAGLRAMLEKGARQVGLDAVVGMAHLKLHDNQFGRAAALLALVRHHRASSWELQEKARKLWEELVAELPPEVIAAAEAEGRGLNLQETAVALLSETRAD